MPFAPVILGSLADDAAVAFASEGDEVQAKDGVPEAVRELTEPPLWLSGAELEGSGDVLGEKVAAAVDEYRQGHDANPEVVCVSGEGLLYVLAKPCRDGGPLANKVAVVTGGAGAIGHGVIRGLLEQGSYVAATDLPGDALNNVEKEFTEIAGDRIRGLPMDVTDADSVAEGFAQLVTAWGGVDIVIVNAGLAHVSSLSEVDLEAFRKLERVNVEGTLLTIRESTDILKRQGTGGDIVLVSTKNVFAPGARFGAYSATKAGSHQLARVASLELAEYGVRVNMVSPDAVFSDGDLKSGLWAAVGPDRMRARGLDEKGLEEYYQNRNLLKARVTARHVANAVLFFVTHQTPTTGATIPVDGGLPDATPR